MKTYEELHAEALQVQDVCNLSGVIHSFSRVMDRLHEIARAESRGTDWINSNSVTRLYASKITSLTGVLLPNDIMCCRECSQLLGNLHKPNCGKVYGTCYTVVLDDCEGVSSK